MTPCIIAALLSMPPLLSPSAEPHARSNLAPEEPEVEAKATVARSVYRPLEPIWVWVDVKNTTDATWLIMRRTVTGQYDIDAEVRIRKDVGMPVNQTEYHKHSEALPIYYKGTLIRPGQSFSVGMFVNLHYDMTAPGQYVMRFEVPYLAEQDDGFKGGSVWTDFVRVTISGRPVCPEADEEADRSQKPQ